MHSANEQQGLDFLRDARPLALNRDNFTISLHQLDL